jgi:hypothetical protein
LVVAVGAEDMIPAFAQPVNRDIGTFSGSKASHVFMHGPSGWFALILVQMIFNVEAGASNRYRSAWVGDAVHSAQTVLFALSWSYSFSSSRRNRNRGP